MQQVVFPGQRYISEQYIGHDSSGFTLKDFLDANYETHSRNIFVVGRPNFPEPALDAAYDLVPLGLARRVVRREAPMALSRWWCESSSAWTTVAEAFRVDKASANDQSGLDLHGHSAKDLKSADKLRNRYRSLALPPSNKYGPESWESTLRIIVYDAAAETAAYCLERILEVPENKRGRTEKELMTGAALFFEVVLHSNNER